mmetsp:Transcript_6447/g.9390  ORF Transcript_6447/g.9390 Transcript_6447/m.9390 type:complete len:255 (-) Transcript_6447:1639-2403(-)
MLTKAILKEVCAEDGCYSVPELNDKLYLNHRSITKIANLEDYTELKCLHLEDNAITDIEGFDAQTKLGVLYLQHNFISRMIGVSKIVSLKTLNLSENSLKKIEGLASLTQLQTLYLAKNEISDISGLKDCPSLQILDLSENKLDNPEAISSYVWTLPIMHYLILKGNPVVRKIKSYQKTMIANMPSLTYIDNYKLNDHDHDYAKAFMEGGIEAERALRKTVAEAKLQKDRDNFKYMEEIMQEARDAAKKNKENV